jgi:hypothetical protein
MSGNTADRATTTTSSTDSGQGSEPLSDAFVAVAAGGASIQGSVRRVEAPRGSAQFLIRRSARVASVQANTVMEIVDAPPGGKRRIGYAYQILDPLPEDGPSIRQIAPAGNGGGFRDTVTPQLGPITGSGRKRSATSAASGSGRHGPTSKRLASAADFSPTHFDEPVSDAPIPEQQPQPSSPMAIEPEVPAQVRGSQHVTTPFSSPISQNPLFQRGAPVATHTPSPSRRRPQPFRTQDGNAAWAAAEGLLPIQEGFTAPGYVPAQIVGGVTYTVRSPQARSPQAHQPIAQRASIGRQLFAEYAGTGIQDDIPQQHSAARAIDVQQQLASQGSRLQQQAAFQDVRSFAQPSYMRIY